MSADVWTSLGTAAATLALLVVPGLVLAWYVLERMIGDDRSYAQVVASTVSRGSARDARLSR